MVDRSLLNSASFFSCSSLATYGTKIHFTKKTELFLSHYLSLLNTYPLLHHRNGQSNFTINHHISPFIIIFTLTTTRILHDLESWYLPRVGRTLLHTHTNQIAPVHKIKVYQVKKSKNQGKKICNVQSSFVITYIQLH